jgi:TIR domain
MNEDSGKVYISYAWGGDSERVANELDADFQKRGIPIVRDKRNLGYKGVISQFMKEIGRANAIVVVVCDKYLKSDNCMFELLEIAKNKDMYDRIFPIVLHDADIYNPVKRTTYMKYWEGALKELDDAMGTFSRANQQGLREELDTRAAINAQIANLTYMLKDMNTLTPEMHANAGFASLVEGVQTRLNATGAPTAVAASAAAAALAAVAQTAAMSPGSASVVVPGLDAGLADLLDTEPSGDALRVNAIANDGTETTLMLLLSSEGELSLQVMDKPSLAALQLPASSWARINRAGVAGSYRVLGALNKISAATVYAAVGRLLADVFGLPDDNYGVDAVHFNTAEEPEDADADDAQADMVEHLDQGLDELLDPKRRGGWHLWVEASDVEDSLLSFFRYAETGELACMVLDNEEAADSLLSKAQRKALLAIGFHRDSSGPYFLPLGHFKKADPAELKALAMQLLGQLWQLPREGVELGAVLDNFDE